MTDTYVYKLELKVCCSCGKEGSIEVNARMQGITNTTFEVETNYPILPDGWGWKYFYDVNENEPRCGGCND